jgi:hypothetical protein
VKGERPRTRSSKKKIMKSYTNSDSWLLNRTAQHNSEPLHRIDFRQQSFNRGLSTAKVLDLLYHETPCFWELRQVVGKWVWIEFGQKQRRSGHNLACLSALAPHVAGDCLPRCDP